MASFYQRRLTWWVQFYHPLSGKLTRESLDTHDPARAKLLRQRFELEIALREARFQAAEAPQNVQKVLGLASVLPGHEAAAGRTPGFARPIRSFQ